MQAPPQQDQIKPQNKKRKMTWKRVILLIVVAIVVGFICSITPVYYEELGDYCAIEAVGFPFRIYHYGYQYNYEGTNTFNHLPIFHFLKSANAQVNVDPGYGTVYATCYVTEFQVKYQYTQYPRVLMIINVVIYFLIFFSIDLLAIKKQNKKYYLLIIPVFLILYAIGIAQPSPSLHIF